MSAHMVVKSKIVSTTLCVNEEGDLIQFTNKELELDYRNSIVQKQHLVVT